MTLQRIKRCLCTFGVFNIIIFILIMHLWSKGQLGLSATLTLFHLDNPETNLLFVAPETDSDTMNGLVLRRQGGGRGISVRGMQGRIGEGGRGGGGQTSLDRSLTSRLETVFFSVLDCPTNLSLSFLDLDDLIADLSQDPACPWINASFRNAERSFVALGGEMAVLKNVTLDPRKFKDGGFGLGGEAISNVLDQKEGVEYFNIESGFFSLPCSSSASLAGVKFHVGRQNYRRSNHLNRWLESIVCSRKGGNGTKHEASGVKANVTSLTQSSSNSFSGASLNRKTPSNNASASTSTKATSIKITSNSNNTSTRSIASLGKSSATNLTSFDANTSSATNNKTTATTINSKRKTQTTTNNNNGPSPTFQSWSDVIRSGYVPGVTLALQRYEYANLYHTMLDWYNAFLSVLLLGIDPRAVTFLLLDGHPWGKLDPTWATLFGGRAVLRAGRLSVVTTFEYMVWVPNGYHCPLFETHRDKVPFLPQLRKYFFQSYGVRPNPGPKCGRLRVLIVSRRDYLAHPRNPKGFLVRKIANEDQVHEALTNAFPSHKVRLVQLDLLTMRNQLRIVAQTDILVGMHGAALTYTLLLPQGAALVEMYPMYAGKTSLLFKKIAEWRGVHYVQWMNKVAARELPNMFTRVPPYAVITMVREMTDKICADRTNS